MLGIRIAPKENLYNSPTEILPGLTSNTKSDPDVKRYLAQLRDSVGQLRPISISTYGTPRSSVPNDLHTAKFVFVQHDTRPKPLQSPYDGPYEVICPGDNWRMTRHMKPVHLDIDSPIQVAQPPNRGRPRQIAPTLGKEQSPKSRVTTRKGRTIKTPSRFQ
uniref:Uncharacterized protein n=1 Tax=Octopus bimaculoides TaxID=37653 RepID=A0A0L8G0L4_OCTBM